MKFMKLFYCGARRYFNPGKLLHHAGVVIHPGKRLSIPLIFLLAFTVGRAGAASPSNFNSFFHPLTLDKPSTPFGYIVQKDTPVQTEITLELVSYAVYGLQSPVNARMELYNTVTGERYVQSFPENNHSFDFTYLTVPVGSYTVMFIANAGYSGPPIKYAIEIREMSAPLRSFNQGSTYTFAERTNYRIWAENWGNIIDN